VNYTNCVDLGRAKTQIGNRGFLNTGRFSSAIAKQLAQELGLIDVDDCCGFS
jgi:hypothetical protein